MRNLPQIDDDLAGVSAVWNITPVKDHEAREGLRVDLNRLLDERIEATRPRPPEFKRMQIVL